MALKGRILGSLYFIVPIEKDKYNVYQELVDTNPDILNILLRNLKRSNKIFRSLRDSELIINIDGIHAFLYKYDVNEKMIHIYMEDMQEIERIEL